MTQKERVVWVGDKIGVWGEAGLLVKLVWNGLVFRKGILLNLIDILFELSQGFEHGFLFNLLFFRQALVIGRSDNPLLTSLNALFDTSYTLAAKVTLPLHNGA